MKPLDIVITPKGGLAVVTEIARDGHAALDFFEHCNKNQEKSAWWSQKDGLRVIDSIPRFLANALAHPGGGNSMQGARFFPLDEMDVKNDEEDEDDDFDEGDEQ